LTWDRVDFATADLVVKRAKSGKTGTHPLTGIERYGHCGSCAVIGQMVAIYSLMNAATQ
jgi:hypothetical protein